MISDAEDVKLLLAALFIVGAAGIGITFLVTHLLARLSYLRAQRNIRRRVRK